MKRQFEVISSPPRVETWELEEVVSEKDLAVADDLLAKLLVRFWASGRLKESSTERQNPLDIRAPVSPHVTGDG